VPQIVHGDARHLGLCTQVVVPVIAGEIGENDYSGSLINPLILWLDSQGAGYLRWTWDDWPGACGSGPILNADCTCTPTNFGAAYKAHITTHTSQHCRNPRRRNPRTAPHTGGRGATRSHHDPSAAT
jgi:hypothetical protein